MGVGDRAFPQHDSLALGLFWGLLQHLSVYTPSSYSSRKGQRSPGERGWEDFTARHHAACSRNIYCFWREKQQDSNNRTQLLDLACWTIFILLFQIINYSLRRLLFSLLPTHLPPPNHHPPTPKYIHTHLNPMGDTGTQAATHPQVYQLVHIDLESGVLEIWVGWGQ